MKRIVTQYLRPYYGRMLVGFAIKFSGTCLDLCLPWVLARMIDVVIPQGERRAIFAWGLVMLGLRPGRRSAISRPTVWPPGWRPGPLRRCGPICSAR